MILQKQYKNNANIKWEQIEISDLERKTEWGWPLLAGFETRIKERR